jgi:hypothetical protein
MRLVGCFLGAAMTDLRIRVQKLESILRASFFLIPRWDARQRLKEWDGSGEEKEGLMMRARTASSCTLGRCQVTHHTANRWERSRFLFIFHSLRLSVSLSLCCSPFLVCVPLGAVQRMHALLSFLSVNVQEYERRWMDCHSVA